MILTEQKKKLARKMEPTEMQVQQQVPVPAVSSLQESEQLQQLGQEPKRKIVSKLRMPQR